MDIQKEWDLFVAHLRTLGVVKIGRNALGIITNLTREGKCSLSYNDIELMWETWQAAKAQAVPEWISVEDGLPIDGQDIIAFDAIKHCVFKDGEFLQGYFEPDTGHGYTEPVDVTHWIAIEAQEQKG